MENQWNKLSSSLTSLNLGWQSTSKVVKGFNSSVQAAKERLGQVSQDELTELPPGNHLQAFNDLSPRSVDRMSIFVEYKELEARVDALRAAHISLLK